MFSKMLRASSLLRDEPSQTGHANCMPALNMAHIPIMGSNLSSPIKRK